MMKGLLNPRDSVAVAGTGTAVETEVQSIALTDGVRGKVTDMGGLLYSTNWKFCTYTSLINVKLISCLSFLW